MAIIEQPQTSDLVIQEVRRIKEALAEAQNFDVRRILAEARANQKASGRVVLPAPVKREA